jgi:hypothetical protein
MVEKIEIQVMGVRVSEDETYWMESPWKVLMIGCSRLRKFGKISIYRCMRCKFVDGTTDWYSSRLMSYLCVASIESRKAIIEMIVHCYFQ